MQTPQFISEGRLSEICKVLKAISKHSRGLIYTHRVAEPGQIISVNANCVAEFSKII